MLRSTECGTLGLDDSDASVTLAGWVDRRRDHGGIIFLDLRDRSGDRAGGGQPRTIGRRRPGGRNSAPRMGGAGKGNCPAAARRKREPGMSTGDIEVMADEITVLNRSLTRLSTSPTTRGPTRR